MKDAQLNLLIACNTLAIVLFSFLFWKQRNPEFMIYIAVIIFFAALILISHSYAKYPYWLLWLLSTWAVLHMAGGGVLIEGKILYTKMLWSLIGEPYHILKYDQAVHAFGFFVATLVMYWVLRPQLRKSHEWTALLIVVAMAGVGLGALNEIIEFIATVVVPETNVGGYVNTSLDLVFNMIGAVAAVFFIKAKEKCWAQE